MTVDLAKVPHGTTRYQSYGCRCPICREAVNRYKREYRARKRDPNPIPVDYTERKNDAGSLGYQVHGRLKTMCWCESAYVWIPAELVRAGRTVACKKAECCE